MTDNKKYIPYREIVNHLDIFPGDTVVVASDVTRLAIQAGRKEGAFDANAFIDSLQDKIGKDGTLVIPAYNHKLRSGARFDIIKTRPQTGALALTAFGRDDFARTSHPLHSFMVWGRHADDFLKLRNKSSFGKDSPFGLMDKLNAKMLFAGTNIASAFTYTHYIEESERVNYRKYLPIRIRYTCLNNETTAKEFVLYKKKCGWDMNLGRLQRIMEAEKDISKWINGINFTLTDAEFAGRIIKNDIRENKAANIAAFSLKLCARTLMKDLLRSLKIYSGTRAKIENASHL